MLKKLSKIFGLLVLLIVILAGLLLLPFVQKTIFLWVANTSDREVKVDSIHFFPGSLTLSGLEFNQDNLALRVPSLELRFSIGALRQRMIRVSQLSMPDFAVKVRETDEVEEKSPPTLLPPDFDGFLSLGWGLDLSDININGTVSIENVSILDITAGTRALKPGTTGNFSIEIVPDNPDTSPIPEATIRLPITLGASGHIEKIELQADFHTRLAEQKVPFRLRGFMERLPTGDEKYHLDFSGAESDEGMATVKISLNGDWNSSKSVLSLLADARLDDSSQLEPFVDSPLPEIALHATAKTSLTPGTRSWSVDFETDANWIPDESIGLSESVEIAAKLSVESSPSGDLTLRRMQAKVSPPSSENPWLSARLLQPQVLSAENLQQLPEETFAAITLDFPGNVIEGFLPGWKVSGLQGSWLVSGQKDGILVEPQKKWTTHMSREDSGQEPASVSFLPKLKYTKEGTLALSISQFTLANNNSRNLISSFSANYDFQENVASQIEWQSKGDLLVLRPFLPADTPKLNGQVNLQLAGDAGDEIGFSGYLKLDNFAIDNATKGTAEILLESMRWTPVDNRGEIGLSGTLSNAKGVNKIDKLQVAFLLPEEDVPQISVKQSQLSLDIPSLLDWVPSEDSLDEVTTHTEMSPSLSELLKREIVIPLNLGAIKGDWIITGDPLPETIQISLSGEGPQHGESRELAFRVGATQSATNWIAGTALTRLTKDGLLERASIQSKVSEDAYLRPLPAFSLQMIYQRARPEEWVYLRMSAADDDSTLLTGTLSPRGNDVLLKANLDLSALSQSSFRTILPNLQTGQLRTELSLRDNDLKGMITVDSLASRGSWQSYRIIMDTELAWSPNLALNSTIAIKEARSKETVLDLKAKHSQEKSLWEVNLKSNDIILEDFMQLPIIGEVGALPQPPQKTSDEKMAKKPTLSAWPLADMEEELRVRAQLDSLTLGEPQIKFSQIELNAEATSQKANLAMSAGFLGNAALSTDVRLSPSDDRVRARISGKADRISLTEVFRLLQPGEAPPVTGTTSLQLSLEGQSALWETLPDALIGNLSVEIRDGVIRSLNPKDRIGRVAQVGTIAGSILGQVIDRPGISALSQVVELFTSIPYQRIALELRRESDQSTAIRSLLFRGPYLSLDGTGFIQPSSLEEIPNSEMQMNLHLGSRPPLTRPLEILGLAGKEKTPDDYRKWRKSYRVTGTLQNPNLDDLWDDLMSAAERAATVRGRDLDTPEQSDAEPEKKQRPEEQLLEQGINELFRRLGR